MSHQCPAKYSFKSLFLGEEGRETMLFSQASHHFGVYASKIMTNTLFKKLPNGLGIWLSR
jgi:hypothetical protein